MSHRADDGIAPFRHTYKTVKNIVYFLISNNLFLFEKILIRSSERNLLEISILIIRRQQGGWHDGLEVDPIEAGRFDKLHHFDQLAYVFSHDGSAEREPHALFHCFDILNCCHNFVVATVCSSSFVMNVSFQTVQG